MKAYLGKQNGCPVITINKSIGESLSNTVEKEYTQEEFNSILNADIEDVKQLVSNILSGEKKESNN